MLNRYVRLIFDETLEPKYINNRAITGIELQQFFIVYCKMFADTATGEGGAYAFPKAMTMLEATSEANNRNAYDISRVYYMKWLDSTAGVNCKYIKEGFLSVSVLCIYTCMCMCVYSVLYMYLYRKLIIHV